MRVFITGASSGIGAAMAKKFDAMGAQLGLVGRSQEKLDAVLSGMHNAQAHRSSPSLPPSPAENSGLNIFRRPIL